MVVVPALVYFWRKKHRQMTEDHSSCIRDYYDIVQPTNTNTTGKNYRKKPAGTITAQGCICRISGDGVL